MDQAYSVRGLMVCRACASKRISDSVDPMPSEEVHPLSDPTICADCRKDNGTEEFPVLIGRRLCSMCRSYQRKIQFPIWARACCSICLVLGTWGFFRSLQQCRGIYLYRRGVLAFKGDQYADAARDLRAASKLMPEDETVQDLEAFYCGCECLEAEKSKEAVHWFKISLNFDHGSKITEHMLLISQRRVAFEEGHYDAYFNASQELLQTDGRTSEALYGMAPAWACKFALTGRKEFAVQARACLKEARELGTPGELADAIWIEAWVDHIIETRSIVSLQEYWRSLGKSTLPDQVFG